MRTPLCAIQGALLALFISGLSSSEVRSSEPPLNPWRNVPSAREASEPVFVSDQEDEPLFEDDYQVDTGADLDLATPVQFRSGGGMRGMGGRTGASPAAMTGSGQRAPQSFAVRLARAPNMMGDFFGVTNNDITAALLVGPAVHHTTSANDIHRIEFTDSSQAQAVYFGGPGGSLPGSYFFPFVTPPAPDLVTGLSSDISGEFFAVKSGEIVDVFDFPADVGVGSPDIAGAEVFQVYQVVPVDVAVTSPGDIVGRSRIQDNNSPMPRDRIFLDYNFFHNARLTTQGINVNRFAPGFERTFWNQQGSVEVRVPVALTLDNDVTTDGITDTSKGQFGNLAITGKLLLTSTDTTALAAGLGVAAPTAGDLEVGMLDGTQLGRVSNDSPHLLPYLAVLYTPLESSWFFQSFLTFDFDTTGNDVFANINGTGLEKVGTFEDQHLATVSVSTGSWFYENYSPASLLRRIGWQAEVHYTQTLNDADSISAGAIQFGNPDSELSLVNGTFGLNVHAGNSIITTGYSVPLTSDDRVFDGELRVFLNRYF